MLYKIDHIHTQFFYYILLKYEHETVWKNGSAAEEQSSIMLLFNR